MLVKAYISMDIHLITFKK